MNRNQEMQSRINSRWDLAQKLTKLDLGILGVLTIFGLEAMFILFRHPLAFGESFAAIGLFGTVLVTSVFLFLQRRRILQELVGPKTLKTDPVLLLNGFGLDLGEYTDVLILNGQELMERLDRISINIKHLNERIHATGEDIGQVYQIVSQLASEEVKLMEAVGTTSTEIQTMFEIVNLVITEIQGRNETMEKLVELSERGGEKVKQTNATIQRISESSSSILRLIDFINGVSKETNLLAINAAIEATHSGSEGKGFTVIAEEIKNLATVTAQNAREITKILKNNIEDYKSAETFGIESGDAFHFIASEIHVVHGTIAEVVQSIGELQSRGDEVLSKAKALDEVAERVRDTSGEVYGEVVMINANLDEIKSLTDQVQKEIHEIQETQDWLSRMTRKMQNKIQDIHQETDSFLEDFLKKNAKPIL